MSDKIIPKREDVPVEFTWDLTDLYESDEAWRREYEALKELPARAAAYEGKLGESADTLLEFMRLEDEAHVRIGMLMDYAGRKNDQDMANALYQDMRGKAVSISVAMSSACGFAAPEIIAIDAARLDAFYQARPELLEYERALFRLRRMAGHMLSAQEETLLAAACEMAQSPDDIAGVFRNADLHFPPVTDSEGVSHPLTNETLVPLLASKDRELRRAAFTAYYARLGEFQNTLAATLDAQFRQLRFFAAARKYSSTLEASLDANEIPTAVYERLIDAVHVNLDKMYRYVALRKRLLGVEELHMYDVYTPIVPPAVSEIDYDTAKRTVLDALGVLGADYTALLQRGFEERWIDVYENQGKRGGAYSSGTSRPHPYVLLNHKDTVDCMFTIAHEMGHAMHSWYSCQAQCVSNADYVIFVAEVASTVNEVLLMRYLLDRAQDKLERASLINHFLDQFKGTVYRQTMFAEFELELGRMSEAGQTLTAEALNEKYLALNKLYFGPDMVSDDEIALEWARIPHFYYDYYVFQYATGFSAAVAIADRILTLGDEAVADYKRFLSAGCSADPISILRLAGVDMSTPAPINSALALFGALIDELDKLI